ncbi:class I SAM-dependent methyltransferase [Reichenbachiella sp. MALMAid0571]|uniref:class I SAM-dependent methyltransferase n=1 Tax=Reichenbachiella sp. MALMAid0571 TaxID=3143939 RepID=UPI0032DE6792
MPSVEFNLSNWNQKYSWEKGGEEWSSPWGGSYMQWLTCILPRINQYLPVRSMLEIACGHGRWTEFLINHTDKLIGVDLSPSCIEICNERFSEIDQAKFMVNDGKSLEMIPDNSIDFVFSFDSLVHVDNDVLDSYISQLPRILKDGGNCFLHHSNLGEYSFIYNNINRVPKLHGFLGRIGVVERNTHLRDPLVTFKTVQVLANKYELKCVSQEIIPWRTKYHKIDCFTILSKNKSDGLTKIVRNPNFMKEACNSKLLSKLYSLQ